MPALGSTVLVPGALLCVLHVHHLCTYGSLHVAPISQMRKLSLRTSTHDAPCPLQRAVGSKVIEYAKHGATVSLAAFHCHHLMEKASAPV